MKDPETVQRLIRLKRYETPGEEYFGSFLEQLQEKQRSERLRRSRREIFGEMVSDWYEENFGRRWTVPVGAAAAATLGAGLYFALPVGESTASTDTDTVAVSARTEEVHSSIPTVAIAAQRDTFESAENEENFSLQLPRPSGRVPSFERSGDPAGGSVVPINASGKFREL